MKLGQWFAVGCLAIVGVLSVMPEEASAFGHRLRRRGGCGSSGGYYGGGGYGGGSWGGGYSGGGYGGGYYSGGGYGGGYYSGGGYGGGGYYGGGYAPGGYGGYDNGYVGGGVRYQNGYVNPNWTNQNGVQGSAVYNESVRQDQFDRAAANGAVLPDNSGRDARGLPAGPSAQGSIQPRGAVNANGARVNAGINSQGNAPGAIRANANLDAQGNAADAARANANLDVQGNAADAARANANVDANPGANVNRPQVDPTDAVPAAPNDGGNLPPAPATSSPNDNPAATDANAGVNGTNQ